MMRRNREQVFWNETSADSVCEFLANGLSENSYVIVDHFLQPEEVIAMRAHMDLLHAQGDFKQAGIGSAHQFHVNKDIRKDWIHWIDARDEATPTTLRAFIQHLQQLMLHINRTCFLGLKDFEMHYAIYPSGAYYKRHLDQFKHNDHRRLTFLCYLNSGWTINDGGQLRLYTQNDKGQEIPLDIEPLAGRLVCFRSDALEHEVLATRATRYSLTGWMLDQLNELTFLK